MITKELLDSWYDIGAEPDGHPNTRREVRLHYVRSVVEPYLKARLDRAKEIFSLNPNDRVLLVGVGYGWGLEYLHRDCSVHGTEIDSYYFDTGTESDYEEVKAAIESVGLDTSQGRGLELLNRCHTPGARMGLPSLITLEDSLTPQSRKRVEQKGKGKFTKVLTEDVLPGLSPDLQDSLCKSLKGYGCEVAHLGGQFTPEMKEIIGTDACISSKGVV